MKAQIVKTMMILIATCLIFAGCNSGIIGAQDAGAKDGTNPTDDGAL